MTKGFSLWWLVLLLPREPPQDQPRRAEQQHRVHDQRTGDIPPHADTPAGESTRDITELLTT